MTSVVARVLAGFPYGYEYGEGGHASASPLLAAVDPGAMSGFTAAAYLLTHLRFFRESYEDDSLDCGGDGDFSRGFSAWTEAMEALPPTQVPTSVDTLELLRVALVNFPECGPLHHLRGAVLFALKSHEAAASSFQMAVRKAGASTTRGGRGIAGDQQFSPLEMAVCGGFAFAHTTSSNE